MSYIERMFSCSRSDWEFWKEWNFMVGKRPHCFRFRVAGLLEAFNRFPTIHSEAWKRIVKKVWQWILLKVMMTNSLYKKRSESNDNLDNLDLKSDPKGWLTSHVSWWVARFPIFFNWHWLSEKFLGDDAD